MPEETFHIVNFGCRATQADGAAIEQAFLDRHLNKAGAWKDSDVVVINTCTVTHSADSQAKQMIRVLLDAGYSRDNPVERFMRDAKGAQIYEGSNQIQRLIIAQQLVAEMKGSDR